MFGEDIGDGGITGTSTDEWGREECSGIVSTLWKFDKLGTSLLRLSGLFFKIVGMDKRFKNPGMYRWGIGIIDELWEEEVREVVSDVTGGEGGCGACV